MKLRPFLKLLAIVLLCVLAAVWFLRNSLGLRLLPTDARLTAQHTVSTAVSDQRSFFCRLRLEVPGADGEVAYLTLSPPNGTRLVTTLRPGQITLAKSLPFLPGSGKLLFKKKRTGKACELIVSGQQNTLRLYTNGRLLHAEKLNEPQSGQIGLRLYCSQKHELRLQKRAAHVFRDDFARKHMFAGNTWTDAGGTWTVRWNAERAASPNPFVCEASAPLDKQGMVLTGYPFWNNYRLGVSVQLRGAEAAGLILGHRQNGTCITLALEQAANRLRTAGCPGRGPPEPSAARRADRRAAAKRQRGTTSLLGRLARGNAKLVLYEQDTTGETRVLNAKPLHLLPQNWYRLEVTLEEPGRLLVFLDGIRMMEIRAPIALFGRVGLLVTGGKALFDDFALASPVPLRQADRLRKLVRQSTAYKSKPLYAKDFRDDHLIRWARDEDAWEPEVFEQEGKTYAGYQFHLPFLDNFDVRFSAANARDVLCLRSWPAQQRRLVQLTEAAQLFQRRGDKLLLDGRKVGSAVPGIPLVIGYYAHVQPAPATTSLRWRKIRSARPRTASRRANSIPEGRKGHSKKKQRDVQKALGKQPLHLPQVYSAKVRQDFFENAPVDWLRVAGTWEITNRWQCKRQWAFYGGYGADEVIQFCKKRFEGNQVHEFYFGMKDLFARAYERRRYARHDLNVSFMTNGRDVFSGYTVLFGGYGNKATFLLREGTVIATNPELKFLSFVDIDDLHLFWRKLRVARVGRRVRVCLDGEVIFDHKEPPNVTIPTGGGLALWTYRNGIIYARLNSTADKITNTSAEYLTPGSMQGEKNAQWQPVEPGRVAVRALGPDRCEVRNLFGGGTFSVKHSLDEPVDLGHTPLLRLYVDIPRKVQVSMHVVVSGRAFILPLTAPGTETYRVLGLDVEHPHSWTPYAMPALQPPAVTPADAKEGLCQELEWDLLKESRKRFPNLPAYKLEKLLIGNTSHQDYLMAGHNANRASTSYRLGIPSFAPRL